MRTNHAQAQSDNDTYICLFEATDIGGFHPQVPSFRHFRFGMLRDPFVDLLIRKFRLGLDPEDIDFFS